MIEMRRWADDEGRVWRVPPGWNGKNVGKCRNCKQLVLWCENPRKLVNGRFVSKPYNAAGTSHFTTCPAHEREPYDPVYRG